MPEKVIRVLASAPLIRSLTKSLHVSIRHNDEPGRHFLASFYHFDLHLPFSREAVLLLPMGQEPAPAPAASQVRPGERGQAAAKSGQSPSCLMVRNAVAPEMVRPTCCIERSRRCLWGERAEPFLPSKNNEGTAPAGGEMTPEGYFCGPQ